MRKTIPTSFSAEPDVLKFLEELPARSMSDFLNQLVRDHMNIKRNPLRLIKAKRKEAIRKAREIHNINEQIKAIQERFNIADEAVTGVHEQALDDVDVEETLREVPA